jgi:hypothetical protein
MNMDFDVMVRMTQKELKSAVAEELAEMGYSVKSANGYVYAPGEIPVLLVAHLDTVHRERVREIYYSKDGNRLMSPEGIGGDDRCGVYIILQAIKNRRCHVLFCEDEETGAVGAREFAKGKIKPKVNYIVEVDRRGADDAVFYNCDNREFSEFVCGFGFSEARGSFSDISVIAPRLGIAAVNLSAGYHNEHSKSEYVDLAEMASVIERLISMVEAPSRKFKYVERAQVSFYSNSGQQILDLWGYMNEPQKEKSELLMPLPESAYLVIDGHQVENRGHYFINARNTVFDYIHHLDAAVKSENTTAHSQSGAPLRFSKEDSIRVRILPVEIALEMLGYVT